MRCEACDCLSPHDGPLPLASPPKRQRIHLRRQFEESRPGGGMQPLERMADAVALDDTAGLHDGLRRSQTALAILEIDEWKDARIRGRGFGAPPGKVVSQDDLD